VTITPTRPVPLAGIAKRQGPYASVEGDLEVNALLLDDGGRSVLLLSFDLLYVGQALRDAVLRAVADRLPPEAVLTIASHTHYAPASDRSKPQLGTVDSEYVRWVELQIGSLVEELWLKPPEPVQLFHGEAEAPENINRRRHRWAVGPRGFRRQQLAPNPQGICDSRLRLLEVRLASGEPLACLWTYACHPVGFPIRQGVHPGYPGVVRSRIRQAISHDMPVLFFQGFAGDLRPRVLDTRRSPLPWLRRMLNGPQFGSFDEGAWQAWTSRIADAAIRAHGAAQPVVPARLDAARFATPLSEVFLGDAGPGALTWQRFRLGVSFEVLGVSAEPVSAYHRELPDHVWAVGYLDNVFGYLPRDADLRSGGYEVVGFLRFFEHSTPLKPGLDRLFRRYVKRLFYSPKA